MIDAEEGEVLSVRGERWGLCVGYSRDGVVCTRGDDGVRSSFFDEQAVSARGEGNLVRTNVRLGKRYVRWWRIQAGEQAVADGLHRDAQDVAVVPLGCGGEHSSTGIRKPVSEVLIQAALMVDSGSRLERHDQDQSGSKGQRHLQLARLAKCDDAHRSIKQSGKKDQHIEARHPERGTKAGSRTNVPSARVADANIERDRQPGQDGPLRQERGDEYRYGEYEQREVIRSRDRRDGQCRDSERRPLQRDAAGRVIAFVAKQEGRRKDKHGQNSLKDREDDW